MLAAYVETRLRAGKQGCSISGLLLTAFASLLSCQPDDWRTGVAAGAAGRYVVTAYTVSGDTLFSMLRGSAGYVPGINRIGVDNFTVITEVTGSDRLTLKTLFRQHGKPYTFSKAVLVRLTSANYQFSLLETNGASVYDGSVGRFNGFFYERTIGGGLLISPAGPQIGPGTVSSQEISLVAQPAR